MFRHVPRTQLIVAALALGTLFATAPQAAGAAAPQAVINANFPDPDLVLADGTYYAYATNSDGRNVQVATAPAPQGPWSAPAEALPTLGGWARTGLTWAPEVTRRADGSYVMYYTARDVASERQCIGTAVSATPAGPFTPVGDGPLVCPAAEGGAIDATTYTAADGARYLLYKNDGNAVGADTWIYLQRLSADGLTLDGDRVPLLKQDRPEERGLIEAPTLVHRGGSYVLLYSAGSYADSSYFIGHATAPALTGPYTKSATPLLTSDSGVTGPGGQDVVSDGTRDWLFLHGILGQDPLVRGMFVAPLTWDGDVPSVA